ncbi:hypothetical protein VOLCADRAFT_82900 [Volvox carteri f. nagariensis]|uniref:Uncharacterized protein n=1 Tax=Volvox carteri f. nagariensis TaxID=3068 RepID=D8U7P4_VOLCA|nr:uncharacterized protein VOLCADRAFT_82900 [Volvox carteri f. nagariensis]EFJ44269.1 hypothetical protein VOLCADRAFT_82900 [Volvox carteri f. nagariensis]|eukprot:XP_002954628.1 hypothetical protein VOLCADRAFT_82900 [Volvox carteri f. nagariensis]
MQMIQQRFHQARVVSCRQLACPRVHGMAQPLVVRSANNGAPQTAEQPSTSTGAEVDLEKEVTKLTRQAAGTFAPRSSTKQKNPAVKGSVLYDIFEYQSWICLVAGGLLSFNIIWPTDEPSIPRLLGMWSIWMFTIPSLRAKECTAKEKDALNILFLLVPLMNVTLPFVWKSFAFIFTSNVIALGAVYWWKGVWKEVYGLPFAYSGAVEAPATVARDSGSSDGAGGGSDGSA